MKSPSSSPLQEKILKRFDDMVYEGEGQRDIVLSKKLAHQFISEVITESFEAGRKEAEFTIKQEVLRELLDYIEDIKLHLIHDSLPTEDEYKKGLRSSLSDKEKGDKE